MLFDVESRTASDFLAAPQRNANSPARLQLQRLKNSHGLHHQGDSGSVVGRAGAGVPRIQMRPDHNHFILQIRTRNLGDRVSAHQVFVVKPHRQIDRHLEFFALLDHSDHAVVILDGHDDLRDDLRSINRPRRYAFVPRRIEWLRH